VWLSTEAEYLASVCLCLPHGKGDNGLAVQSFEQIDSTTLFCDNQSDVRLVTNPEFHKRTNNHIEVQHHFFREKQNDGFLHILPARTICLKKRSSRNILLNPFLATF
jgi:hypothetical protein